MRSNDTPVSTPFRFLNAVLLTLACIGLTSCGNYSAGNLAKKSVKTVSKSVAGIMPSRMPIATVREGDLEKMPTGADRALAWERHLNSKRYASYSGWKIPKNYKQPTLPDELNHPIDGGLLPPLNPGEATTLDAQGLLPQN